MPKTQTRMERGIALHRSRGHEIREVEPGMFRVPASEGGGFYRVNLDAETCECADRAPVCKHLFAATISAAKKRCRRATDRPQRRHGQQQERHGDVAPRPGTNRSGGRQGSAPQPGDEVGSDSLRGVVADPERLAATADKLGV